MKSPEQFNPEENAKEVIESLKDTPAGEYMEGQPMPSEEELEEEGSAIMTKEQFLEYKEALHQDLFAWLYRLLPDNDERELVKQGILNGDYAEVEFLLKKYMEEWGDNGTVQGLLDRINAELYKAAIRRNQLDVFTELKKQFEKNKE